MRRLLGAWLVGIVAAFGLLATMAAAADGPLAVSPGSASGTVISDSCPTFSWGVVQGAQSYELVAYKVPKGLSPGTTLDELTELWSVSVPGTARGWSPPADECFTHGGRFAWAVRAVMNGRESAWSEANLFTVEKAPSTEEVRQAMATIQRYLSSHQGKLPAAQAMSVASKRSKAGLSGKKVKKKAQAPKAVSGVDFSVDGAGNVAGASFTGGAFSGTSFAASGGDVTTDQQLVSTLATGTPPLTVSSATLVSNLNSDTVDGFHAAATPTAGDLVVLGADGTLPATTLANVSAVAQVPRSNSITSTRFGGLDTSITIGSDGFPVIASNDNGLLVVHCTDASCSTYYFVGVGGPTGVRSTSIAIGPDGFPVVICGGTYEVHCLDTSCSTSEIKTTSPGTHASLAIGTDGFPIVSFFDDPDLMVLHCTSLNCSSVDSITTIPHGSSPSVGFYNSIAIGTDGFPVISAYLGDPSLGHGSLIVVHCTDASCSTFGTRGVDGGSTVDVGQYTSIAVGADGFPVVSYYESTNGNLKVAHCTSVDCSTIGTPTFVDKTAGVGEYTSITIGTDGFPVISYYDSTNGNLKVAHCNDVGCSSATLATVDSTDDVGQYSSITIGPDGLPVISYYDATNRDLKVAKCADRLCLNNWTTR